MSNSNHEKFLKHLEQSKAGVWSVAKMLSEKGYGVSIPATTKAKTHKEWKDHADGGDLFISQRVEVKQLGYEFSSVEDWPFKDKFLICAVHSFDKAQPKPYCYVILSKSGKNAAAVFSRDSKHWYIEQRTDRRYENYASTSYLSPLNLVHFFKMPEQP